MYILLSFEKEKKRNMYVLKEKQKYSRVSQGIQ